MRIRSDGCSGVPDWRVWTCWEHDIHYKHARTLAGAKLNRRQADWILRRRIEQASELGALSAHAWFWWVGVRIGGFVAWHRHRRADREHVKA